MKIIHILFVFLFFSNSIYAQNHKGVIVEIDTKYGNIELLLYDETPGHQENFLKLVRSGFYKNQLFHRVIPNMIIQGGDPNSVNAPSGEMLGTGGPGYTIPREFRDDFYHKRGVLAAARRPDSVNPSKASSGSQFYIVQGRKFTRGQLDAYVRTGKHRVFTEKEIHDYTTFGGLPHLDGEYTVFGEVIKGMEIVDHITTLAVDGNNRPVEDVIFNIRIVKE